MKYKLLLIILLCQATSRAQIETDRPSQTDAPTTVGLGYFQMENALEYKYYNYQISNYSYYTWNSLNLPLIQMRYGISDRWELRGGFAFDYYRLDNYNLKSSGYKNNLAYLGAKYALVNHPKFKSSLISEVSYLYNSNWAFNLRLPTMYKIDEHWTISGLLGTSLNTYSSIPQGTGVYSDMKYTINIGYNPNPHWTVFLEHYGTVDFQKKLYGRNFYTPYLDAGFSYRWNDNNQIDLYITERLFLEKNIYKGSKISYYSLGYSFRIPTKSTKSKE